MFVSETANTTLPTMIAFGSMKLLHKKLGDTKELNLDLMQVPEIQALAIDQARKELCFVSTIYSLLNSSGEMHF